MRSAGWTVEVPDVSEASSGLEDYELRAADGQHLGIVASVVTHEGDAFLVSDAGLMPPFLHAWRAYPWGEVASVDHAALVVRLAASAAELEERALGFDRRQIVHGAGADAPRMDEPPGGRPPAIAPGSAGPLGGLGWITSAAAAGASTLSLFVIVVLWATRGLQGADYAAFAVPALLAALAVSLLGYALYREPHSGHRRPHGGHVGSR
jgi:hypothetical protein